ncbi:hypothetical protein IGI37_000727 [Enterococcus sp. AZ194]|uniref:ROK family protein n=1 Tax=Enterococcus sp. AZ194 TaxID=2774629 RepID=UPI003F26AA27
MISTKHSIREKNESSILNAIIHNKEISRASLSELTSMNKSSVSSIIKSLLDDDLILEARVGDASTQGGRKPIMLRFNGQSALVIAFDIASNYIEGMLAYIDGTIINSISKDNYALSSGNIIVEMSHIIDQFIIDQPETTHGIVGITAAIHGIVNNNLIEFTPYYDLADYNLHSLISQQYNIPFFIYNEANLAALGEYTFSSEYNNLVSLSVHKGIGAGIVKNGALEVGENGHAGEIGHTILFPQGRHCPCGNSGCTERYASNSALYEKIAKIKNYHFVDATVIQKLWSENDSETIREIEQTAKYIAITLNNIIMQNDPEIIILNSYLYRKIPQIVEMIINDLNSHFTKNIVIRNTVLNGKATLFGGIAIAAQEFLKIKQLKLYPHKILTT